MEDFYFVRVEFSKISKCDVTFIREMRVTGNQEHPKTTVVEVYNSRENIDKDDENVDDTCEQTKLAISSKQIIEGTSQLPGQV